MPKVTQAHMDARRQQIIEAAQTCFSRQGFHQTSIQDICKEAGLSPGAVYRYFPGKVQIIAAACTGCQEANSLLIESAQSQANSWSEVLDQLVDYGFGSMERPEFREHIRMMVQLWSEALNSDEVNKALLLATFDTWIQPFTELFQTAQAEGAIDPGLEPRAVAGLMIALWHGVVLETALNPGLDVSAYPAALKALYHGTLRTRIAPTMPDQV